MMPYEKSEAWKVTHTLALEIYRVTCGGPALWAPANIAEGAAKRGPRKEILESWMRRHSWR